MTFNTRIENAPNYQGNAVINYTSHDVPFTRVIEHKHFEAFGQAIYDTPKTVASEEYSIEYKSGMEQFYPVNDARNNALADQYRSLTAQEQNILFVYFVQIGFGHRLCRHMPLVSCARYFR